MSDWQNSPPADDWTIDELMIARLADCFADGDQACNGMASFVPVSAFWLARLTHAPDLVWLAGAVGLEPRPDRVPASTLEAPLWRDSIMYVEQYGDFWNFALNGRWLTKFCVGAAQLDRYGNGNNSVIGTDYHNPRVRLPGTAGLGDMGSIGKALYYWNPNHNPRSLVEEGGLHLMRWLPGRRFREDRRRVGRRTRTGDHQSGRNGLPPRHPPHAGGVAAPGCDLRAGAGGHRL